MYHIVYKTIRLSTGEYYIGIHSTNDLNDKYMGSGDRIKRIISKYGKDDLQRIILKECASRKEALEHEHQLVTVDLLEDPLCLNTTVGGKGNPNGGHSITEGAKSALSSLHRGKVLSEETKRRISESKKGQPSKLKGQQRSNAVRQKISDGLKGRVVSDETKKKLSDANLGKRRPEEVTEKIRKARIGKLHSPESIRKMKKPKPIVRCPHCGKEGGISVMKRWHFDNCSENAT